MAQMARNDMKERKIEVKRVDLLEKLKANREKHLADYREALDGYKSTAFRKLEEGHEKAKGSLEKNVAQVRKQIEEFNPNDPQVSSYLTLVEAIQINLKVPHDYSKEYDAAIDMVSWDVRETLELTHAEFQCFVRDVWDWSDDFAHTSAIYKAAKF